MKIIQPIGNFHLSSSSQKLIIIKQQASHLRNYPSFQYHPSILVTSTGNNLYGSTVERILTANACFFVYFIFFPLSLMHTRTFVYTVEHADGMHMIYMYIYIQCWDKARKQKIQKAFDACIQSNRRNLPRVRFDVIIALTLAFTSRTIAFALSIFCTNIDETIYLCIYWALSTHALTK